MGNEHMVALHRGGAAQRYDTTSAVPSYLGTVRIFDYGKLCYLIEQLGLERHPPRFGEGGVDTETYILTVTKGTTTRSIVDNGEVGPIELWGLRQAIGGVAAKIEWKANR